MKQRKDLFIKPGIMAEAAQTGRGKHWAVEILIFFLIAIIVFIELIYFAMLIGLAYGFSRPEFWEIAKSGAVNESSVQQLILGALPLALPLFIMLEVFFLVAAVVYCTQIEKRSMRTLGFVKKNFAAEYLLGLLTGLALLAAAHLLGYLSGNYAIRLSSQASVATLLFYFFAFMIQGMSEEVFFRSYLLVSLSKRYSLPVSILISSTLFALFHVFNPGTDAAQLFALGLFGVFAALTFIRRGNVWFAGGLHGMWNFTLVNLTGAGLEDKYRISVFISKISNENLHVVFLAAVMMTAVLVMAALMLHTRERADAAQAKTALPIPDTDHSIE